MMEKTTRITKTEAVDIRISIEELVQILKEKFSIPENSAISALWIDPDHYDNFNPYQSKKDRVPTYLSAHIDVLRIEFSKTEEDVTRE